MGGDKKQRLEEAINQAKQGSIAYLIGFGIGLIPVIGALGIVVQIYSIVKFYKAFSIFSEVWEEPKLIKYYKNLLIIGIGGALLSTGLLGIGVGMESEAIVVVAGITVIAIAIFSLVMYVKLIRIFEEFTGHQLFKVARILFYTVILAGIGMLLFSIAFITEEVQNLLRQTLVEVDVQDEDLAMKERIE